MRGFGVKEMDFGVKCGDLERIKGIWGEMRGFGVK